LYSNNAVIPYFWAKFTFLNHILMIKITGPRFLMASLALFAGSFASINAQNSPGSKTKKERQAEKRERINKMIMQEEEGALIYQKQTLFGVKLYSDGWAALFEKGYMKTVNKTNLFSLEIGERKDRKEQKVSKGSNSSFLAGNPFVFGKQNNFFFAKLGVGQSYLLGGKGNRNGVAISAVYSGGVSIGLLKPYYIDISDPTTREITAIKWQGDSSTNDQNFLRPDLIEGGSGVFKGFGELKVKPGLFAKGALRFDYGRYNELISAVEAGFNAEYYASGMPIMVGNDPKKFFLNVFVALEFGKRK
jgi:hypothetical protein